MPPGYAQYNDAARRAQIRTQTRTAADDADTPPVAGPPSTLPPNQTEAETILRTPSQLERQLGISTAPQNEGGTATQPSAVSDETETASQTTPSNDAPVISGLDASDRKFYAMSPNEGALQRFDDGYSAQTAIENIQTNGVVIADRDQSMDDRQDAVNSSTAQVEVLSEIEDPAIRNAALESVQPELITVGSNLVILNGNDTETAIGQLTRATENLGTEHGTLVANPIAHGLHVVTPANLANTRELSEGITKSIENGDGALFAVLATQDLSYDHDLRSTIAEAGAKGIETLNENFNEAEAEKVTLERQIARYVTEFGDTLTEEELASGIDAVIAENQETLDRYNEAAGALGTTFNGISILQSGLFLTVPEDKRAELWTVGDAVRDNLDSVVETEAGLNLLGDAIEDSASGDSNFFTEFTDYFDNVTKPQAAADAFGNAVLKATAARADRLIAHNDYEGAARLFRGFEQSAPLLQVNDPAKLTRLTELLEDQANASTRLSAAEFSEAFAEASGEVKGRVGVPGTSGVARSFQVLGLAVGASALAGDLTLKDIDREQAFRSLVDASGLSGDLSALLPEGQISKEFLGNFGKLARVGAIFEVVDIYRALDAGDNFKAGLGVASLVGTILTTTSLGGPGGTAVGAALSVVAVAGSFALSHYRSNQAEDRAEEGLGTFLTGAGFSEEEAKILRDVRGDSHESIGRIFTQIADTHPDLEPRDVLELFLNPGAYESDDFGGVPLSSGDIELIDNRRDIVDEIENLERNEDGTFTTESVRKAIAIFETQLGVSIRADGLTPEVALQNIESDFNTFDLNNDGQVSDDELKQFTDPLNGAAGPLTPEQTERQNLANYILDRENLFDRLDVGGGIGSGNDKISRQDIDDVQEQNRHLAVIRANLDTFDVAKHPDGTPDGTISTTDLRRIRDGNYSTELKEAARFILDNRSELMLTGNFTQADVHDSWLSLNG